MPTIILHDEDVFRLAESVNAKQADGYAPTGGVLYSNGLYIQPMATGTTTEVYFIVREQETTAFAARANAQPALGTLQHIDGFFIQAFGAEAASGGGTVTVDNITDAGATGKAVLKAATGPAARTALGASPTGNDLFIAADATAARTLIGAGTSNLGIGTGPLQAMAGNKTLADIGGVVPAAGIPVAGTTRGGVIRGVAVTDGTASPSTVPAALDPAADLATTVETVNALITCVTTVRGNATNGITQLNALLASLRTGGTIAS